MIRTISAPLDVLSLTPSFSWVKVGPKPVPTVSTVSTMYPKPLKRFSASSHFRTQLKQGVNESASMRWSKLHEIPWLNHFRFARGCILLLFLMMPALNCFASTNDLFSTGCDAFKSGQFADAAKAFRGDAAAQPGVGTLLNLGLAEWRRGRAGDAILAWEQAAWLNPFDANVQTNLQYARDFIGIETPDYFWYEHASAWLPANAWAWIACTSLWLAVGMAVLPGVMRWRKAGWQQALAALGLVIFLLVIPMNVGAVTRTKMGFVVQRDSTLRLTPVSESESITKLSAGEPARELRRRGDYVLVQTPRGKGWIVKYQFSLVCP